MTKRLDDVNEQAVAFSAGLVVGIIASLNPERSVATIERELRLHLRQMDIVNNDSWIKNYFEYLSTVIISGDAFSISELERQMSANLSIGFAATQNLDALPEVGVMPSPDDDYGVPPEFLGDN